MNTTSNTSKVVFLPGCFDEFTGSQEELDALVSEIQDLAESGQLDLLVQENSMQHIESINVDEGTDIESIINSRPPRNLQ